MWRTVVAALITFCGVATLSAQSTPRHLTVGVVDAPPVALQGEDGWDGIGVHLWRDAAEALDVTYDWHPLEAANAVEALEGGTVDVVIGLQPRAPLEGTLDFTHPYLSSSLGLAEPARKSFFEIAGALLTPRFWRIVLWLSLAFLVVGLLAWVFERKQNEEQFGGGAGRGIWAGFWWAGVTMSTIGYGDKVPVTVGGRIVALLWMLVAMAVTASLTAGLTSALSAGTRTATSFPGDLRSMSVGTEPASAAARFLQEERVRFEGLPVAKGMTKVHEGDLDVYVHDAAVLRYQNDATLKGALRVKATGTNPQLHVFAVRDGSPLREQLNRIVLDHTEEPAWRALIERYVPHR